MQSGITYKQCAELPVRINYANTVVIDDKVYCGGGMTDHSDEDYVIYCYDSSRDNWTALPPLPVKWFGLGQISGKLVAIGGVKKSDHQATNELCTYSQQSQKWKQKIPPMPTVRWSPGVFNLQSALIVAGGYEIPTHAYTTAVEVFKPDTSQWYRTDPLPTPYQDVSVVAIGNTCYALGGPTMAHSLIKHSMLQLKISLVTLYQPIKPPTVVVLALSQRGRLCLILQPIDQLQPCYLAVFLL